MRGYSTGAGGNGALWIVGWRGLLEGGRILLVGCGNDSRSMSCAAVRPSRWDGAACSRHLPGFRPLRRTSPWAIFDGSLREQHYPMLDCRFVDRF